LEIQQPKSFAIIYESFFQQGLEKPLEKLSRIIKITVQRIRRFAI